MYVGGGVTLDSWKVVCLSRNTGCWSRQGLVITQGCWQPQETGSPSPHLGLPPLSWSPAVTLTLCFEARFWESSWQLEIQPLLPSQHLTVSLGLSAGRLRGLGRLP